MRKSNKILDGIWLGIKSFGLFWKDFLIGDTPEIALGVVVILGVAVLLRHYPIIIEFIMILLAIFLLIATVWRRAHK